MGSSFSWSEMPSNTWRLAFLLYAFGALLDKCAILYSIVYTRTRDSGSGLMAFCAAAAIPSLCCADVRHQQCVKTVAKLQMAAGTWHIVPSTAMHCSSLYTVTCMSFGLLAVLYSTHDGSLVCNADLWSLEKRSQCALGSVHHQCVNQSNNQSRFKVDLRYGDDHVLCGHAVSGARQDDHARHSKDGTRRQ